VAADSGATVFFRTLPTGAPPRRDLTWLFQRATKLVVWLYMRLVHRYRIRYHPRLPSGTAYIVVMSHTSWLDVPALMVADPYDPPTSMIIKSETLRIPVLSWILRRWGAIGVARSGRDVSALRRIRDVLAEGRGICVAPSGTRSPDGRLGPFSPVLVRLIIQSGVPVIPVAIVGSHEALPKGSKRLRATTIRLDSGPPVDLADFQGRRLTEADLELAAERLRDAIEALLPAYMHHAPDAPVLGRYLESVATI
jgi:1-acyl-sn-glycerol-3-phosphate acyltransferase